MSQERKAAWRRVFATQNVIAVLVGVVFFLVGLRVWDTTLGVVLAGAAAALASGLVWLIWWYRQGPPAAVKTLGAVHLGTVPRAKAPAPTLLDATSPPSEGYRDLVTAIQSQTTGQVLLLSPSTPEQAPSHVALNLAVAATQLGRRALLIDGDLDGMGLSRFSSSGNDVGLTDIARGEATLAEASQMWEVGNGSLLPVVTAGTAQAADDVPLDGLDLAAAFDVIGEQADLVLIDAPLIT